MSEWDVVSSQPMAADDPWAVVHSTEAPGVVEDVAKSGVSGGAKGAIGLLGLGGDLQGLMSKMDISPWLEAHTPGADFLKAETEKSTKSGIGSALVRGSGDVPGTYKLPNSKQIQSAVEDWTGPFYEPKTTAGRITHTATELAPGLALGGGAPLGLAAKALGGGVVSEGAGELAKAGKGYLPEGAQPYAEPVARAVGAVAGTFGPAALRKVVTPNAMTDQQLNTVNALRAREPDFPMTAGQATQSPRLMNLEGRSPLGQNMGARQEEAFTHAAQREAGLPAGPYDVTGIDQVGSQLGQIRRGNSINSQEFQDLNRLISQERIRLQGTVGSQHSQVVRDLQNEIRQGAAGAQSGVLNMPGARYEFMRDRVQGLIDAAGSPQEKMALSHIRQGLDNAFYNSVGPDVANQVRGLETNYANAKVLSNVPPKVGRETVTPQEVKGAISSSWGRPAANENRGTLGPLAEDATRVMTPHPPVPDKPPAWFDLASAGAGGLIHGGGGAVAGHGLAGFPGAVLGASVGGSEGAVLGHLLADSLYKAGSRAVGSAVSNRPAQTYLGNQLWRPGPNTSAERDLILRALLSPAVNSPSAQ